MKTAIPVQILPGFNYIMHFDCGMWCLVSRLGRVAINESKKYYCHLHILGRGGRERQNKTLELEVLEVSSQQYYCITIAKNWKYNATCCVITSYIYVCICRHAVTL